MNKFILLMLCLMIPGVAGAKKTPLFENSVVSNDLEFIQTDDQSVFFA